MAHRHNPGFEALCEAARRRVQETTVPDVTARKQRGEAFHLVDIREDHEWDRGRLPGARHIGRGILERDIETAIPDRGAPIVLYCGGGYRSVLAAESLMAMGYTDVRSMAGGFRAWCEAGLPTTDEDE